MGAAIDLNADVGESFGRWQLGDDAALLPHLTSANVACGFHAGDPRTIRETVRGCVSLGVVIGAQVSYPDLVGFGRRVMHVGAEDLAADVLYQLGALDGLARTEGGEVAYVKAHGALYLRTLDDEAQAGALASAVAAWGRDLPVLTTAGGALAEAAAAAGLRVVSEGFADRAYGDDGRIVPRSQPGAVLDDPATAAAQAERLAASGSYESLCVHGDTPGAAAMAAAVRRRLLDAGYDIVSFLDRR